MLREFWVPESWQSVQRVLVIAAAEGEATLPILPLLRVLQAALPEGELSLMVDQSATDLDPLQPWVTEVLVYDGALPDRARDQQWITTLRARNFDAALILTRQGESPYPLAYLCYLAGIPIRVGQSQEFGGGVLSDWVKPLAGVCPIEHHLHLLRAIGFRVEEKVLNWHCSAAKVIHPDRSEGRSLLTGQLQQSVYRDGA